MAKCPGYRGDPLLRPRTVEDKVGLAHRKLGIGSRAELGARLDEIRAALS